MSPGFHWKWAFRHPKRAILSAIKFSRLEGIPMWQLPYTFYSLGWEGGGLIDRFVRWLKIPQTSLIADDRIMTRRYE